MLSYTIVNIEDREKSSPIHFEKIFGIRRVTGTFWRFFKKVRNPPKNYEGSAEKINKNYSWSATALFPNQEQRSAKFKPPPA